MGRDSKRESSVEALEQEFVGAVVKETGFTPSLALVVVKPIIRHLVSQYAGDRLYVPAPKRQYPADEIREAMQLTNNAEAVCDRFGISRATLYRVLKGDAVSGFGET